MNARFLAAGIVTSVSVCLHVYTMEHWIYPKLKDEGFPATPFGDSAQTKKSYRLVWHLFTINFLTSAAAQFIMALTDWISDPVLLGRFIAINWLGFMLVGFWIAEFQPRQLLRAWQWTLQLLIAGLTWWGTIGSRT